MSFDEEARLSAEALGTHLSREIQERLQEFVGRLVDAAEQDRQSSTDKAEQTLAMMREEHQQQRQVLAEQAEQALAASERTLQEAVARARDEALQEATARFDAELADRSAKFEELFTERTAKFEAEHTDLVARLEAEFTERTAKFESEHAVKFSAEHAARLDATHADRTARLEAEHDERVARLQAEHESRLHAVQAEREAALERDAIERQTAEREALVAGVRRLVNGFRRLDEGQSLSQLLDTLGSQASAEAARCALFVVRGRALQGWSLAGFSPAPADARSVTIGLDALPDFARVISQGQRGEVRTSAFASDAAEILAFMNHPSVDTGVVVPVTVGGQVAALVYADDGGREDRPVPASWPEAIELLARHAARCLEAQTAIRAARLSNTGASAPAAAPGPQLRAVPTPVPAPQPAAPVAVVPPSPAPVAASGMSDAYAEEHARRYARLLIADIRLYNEAAVRTGREQRDLAHRLQPEIARARHAFEERVPASVRQRERFFDEELVRTLADGDEALLGGESQGTQPESLAV